MGGAVDLFGHHIPAPILFAPIGINKVRSPRVLELVLFLLKGVRRSITLKGNSSPPKSQESSVFRYAPACLVLLMFPEP